LQEVEPLLLKLYQILFGHIKDGLDGISLSANWMWACKNEGEDARLYAAVESCSNFAIELSIFQQEKIPFDETKYPNESNCARTVIISGRKLC
jgi:phosphoribosylformylglycinamidine synthase